MKYDTNLNEFNRLFADKLLPVFPKDVEAMQSEREDLVFRGPVPKSNGRTHISTHVSVKLTEEVKQALSKAEPAERAKIMDILVCNLGNQVRAQYDPNNIGKIALPVTGTMEIING